MTIQISVKPRQDNLFDIWVGDEGDHFVNSNQGYSNVEDAVDIVHRLWPPFMSAINIDAFRADMESRGLPGESIDAVVHFLTLNPPAPPEPVVLTITYRDGTTRTEQLR